jgi:ketosteroid isomerase-like protein
VTGTQSDVETRLRARFDAHNRRDWDAVFAELAPDAEWDPVEENVVYRGRDAIQEYFERWLAPWAEFRVEVERMEVAPSADRVITTARYIGKIPDSEAAIDGRFFQVARLRDGQFWRTKEFVDEAEARAAFEQA